MKKLDTPHHAPQDRYPYYRTDDPDCDWVRVPTPGRYADAMDGVSSLSGALQSEAVVGAVIALAWSSTTHDLESPEKRHRVSGDPLDVVEELHDAGWSQARIVRLASLIITKVGDSTTTEDEVTEAEDFSGGTQPSG